MENEVSTMEAIQARHAEFRAYLVTLGQSLASGEITEPWLPDVWDMENEENYGQDEEPEDGGGGDGGGEGTEPPAALLHAFAQGLGDGGTFSHTANPHAAVDMAEALARRSGTPPVVFASKGHPGAAHHVAAAVSWPPTEHSVPHILARHGHDLHVALHHLAQLPGVTVHHNPNYTPETADGSLTKGIGGGTMYTGTCHADLASTYGGTAPPSPSLIGILPDDGPRKGVTNLPGMEGIKVAVLLGQGRLRKAVGKHDVSGEARDKAGKWTDGGQGSLDVAPARATYPDGRMKPAEGDTVYKTVPGAFGSPATVHGKVRGGRIYMTGSDGMIPLDTSRVKPQPITPEWNVIGDPFLAQRNADLKAAAAAKIKARKDEEAAAARKFAAAKKKHGDLTDVQAGDVLQHLMGGSPHVVHNVDGFGAEGTDVAEDPRTSYNVGLDASKHRRLTEAEVAKLPAAHKKNIAAIRSGDVQRERDAEAKRLAGEEAAAEAAKNQAKASHGTIKERLGAAKTAQIGTLHHGKEAHPLYVGLGKRGIEVFIKHEGGKEVMPVYMNIEDGVAEVATDLQDSLDSTPSNKGKFRVSLGDTPAPAPPKPAVAKTAAGKSVPKSKVTALLNSYTKGGVHPDALGTWKEAEGGGFVVTPKARVQYSRDRHAARLAAAMGTMGYATAYGERTIHFTPKPLSKGVTTRDVSQEARVPKGNKGGGEFAKTGTGMTNTTKSIIDRIEQMKPEYDASLTWGVRWDSPGLAVSHVFDVSRVWDDNEPTDETLNGTCAVQETHLARVKGIYPGVPYIVAGYMAGYGEDAGEVILRECEVMGVVDKGSGLTKGVSPFALPGWNPFGE